MGTFRAWNIFAALLLLSGCQDSDLLASYVDHVIALGSASASSEDHRIVLLSRSVTFKVTHFFQSTKESCDGVGSKKVCKQVPFTDSKTEEIQSDLRVS